MPGTAVGDGEAHERAVAPKRHVDRRVRVGMRADVREEVVHDLPQPVAVADDVGLLEPAFDRPLGLDRAGGLDRLGDDVAEVERLARERPSLVEAREQQQVFDETRSCAPTRDEMPAIERSRSSGRCAAPREKSSAVGANGGERRAQLVRRVGDETPQLALRRLARAERRLDLREHRVQGEPEPADLGALVLPGDAVRQVAGRDRRGGRADLGERPEPDADHPETERRVMPPSTASVTSSSTRTRRCSVLSTLLRATWRRSGRSRCPGTLEARTR